MRNKGITFIGIILILLLSLFSGHVLVAPAISIYIAIIIGITKGGIYEHGS